jgi:hypothetical protein
MTSFPFTATGIAPSLACWTTRPGNIGGLDNMGGTVLTVIRDAKAGVSTPGACSEADA